MEAVVVAPVQLQQALAVMEVTPVVVVAVEAQDTA
jgi:hypothetical protein